MIRSPIPVLTGPDVELTSLTSLARLYDRALYLWIIDKGWASTVSVLLELAVQLTFETFEFLVDTLHIGVNTPFQPVSDVRRLIDLRTADARWLSGPRHGWQAGVLGVYLHNGVWCSARLRQGRSTSVAAAGVTSFQYRLHLIRCLLFRDHSVSAVSRTVSSFVGFLALVGLQGSFQAQKTNQRCSTRIKRVYVTTSVVNKEMSNRKWRQQITWSLMYPAQPLRGPSVCRWVNAAVDVTVSLDICNCTLHCLRANWPIQDGQIKNVITQETIDRSNNETYKVTFAVQNLTSAK